jgi:exosortase/archaeosortase family protein
MKKEKKVLKKARENSDATELEKRKKRKVALKFLGIFLGTMVAYYALVFLFKETMFNWYMELSACLAGAVLNIAGSGVEISQCVISSGDYAISVSYGCEGTEPIALFVAAVLAFPVARREKLIGAISGSAILFVLNIFRIAALYLIGKGDPVTAQSFHLEIFPIVFILFVIIIWGIWIRWALKKRGISA